MFFRHLQLKIFQPNLPSFRRHRRRSSGREQGQSRQLVLRRRRRYRRRCLLREQRSCRRLLIFSEGRLPAQNFGFTAFDMVRVKVVRDEVWGESVVHHLGGGAAAD